MFENRLAVISGGSSGLGLALAERLLARGARVVLLARDEAKLEEARRSLGGDAPSMVATHSCDVSDADSVKSTFERIAGEFGDVDILVSSAGILAEGRFEDQSLETFRRVMDVNYFGTLHLIQAALPSLKKTRGRIVNVASVAGLLGAFGYASYCSSKHALVGLTETLRCELAPRGIRVHLVCPPEFVSPMTADLDSHRTPENKAIVHNIPVMTTEAVANETMAGIERDRFLILTGRATRTTVTAARMFPGVSRRVVDRTVRRVQAKRSRSS